MCNQIRAALCVLLTAISGSLHPATGQSCSLPETMNLNYVSGISWSCRDKTLPCKPKAELLRAEEKGGEKPIGILRSCDRDAPPQGRLIVSRTDQTFPLQSPQVLQAKASAPSTLKLSCYKMDELLDYHQELGSTQIKLEPGEIFSVRRARTGLAELSLPAPLKIVPNGESTREKPRVQVTVAIIATENALRMAPLADWETRWGSDPRDASIDREVLWISISLDGKLEIQQKKSDPKLGGLVPSAKRPLKDTGSGLDGKPVLKKIAEFLASQATEDVQKLDYVIFLKEGWAPSLEGVEALSTQLERLRPDATFDIVSAQTITNERGILQSLATDRVGGNYFESVAADRIEIRGQDFGGRVLGRIRHQADAKARARGIELVPAPIVTATVAVKLDAVPFELGNLATPEQVSMMTSVLELALCLSNREEIEVPLALLTAISRAGLPFQMETALGELFRTWFSGFELPQESPLFQWTFLDLIREARQPEPKVPLDKILRGLRKLPQRDTNCALFVPSSLFLPGK